MNAQSNTKADQHSRSDENALLKVDQQKSSCLLLGLNELNMLVPRALVAEVIKYAFVEIKHDETTGLNSFDWRGCQVPMVPGDLIGQLDAKEFDEEARVLIFYGLRHPQDLPFYAITATKSPQLLQVGDEDLVEDIESELQAVELMKIVINGSGAFIPKIDYLENATLESLQLQEQ